MQVTNHRFASVEDAKAFALAGNATMTLESLRSGVHFTFKVRQAKDKETQQPVDGLYFVSLLHGQDNDSDDSYMYLGMIRQGRFTLTKGSKAGAEAPSVRAWSWFWALPNGQVPEALVVRHEGRCGRCGRVLTVPESIDRGIGPECASKME